MGSRVRLCERKDQHPHNARPKTILFSLVLLFHDDGGLLFYFHKTKNGHKILVPTNPTKNCLEYSQDGLKVVYFNLLLRFNLSLFILGINDSDYFGKKIIDLSGGRSKYTRILPRLFKKFTSRFSWNATANTRDLSLVF